MSVKVAPGRLGGRLIAGEDGSETKVCIHCGKEKPARLFTIHKSNRFDHERRRTTCNPCRRRLPGSLRYSQKYSRITAMQKREADALFRDEMGLTACQICGHEDDLHVDHVHETGELRGLLCRRCNVGIGFFQDDIDRLRCAITYLQRGK